MENRPLPNSYTERRALFGPIRRGQWWVKCDTGLLMQIKNSSSDNCWRCHFVGRHGGKASHLLKDRDIIKFYRPLNVGKR